MPYSVEPVDHSSLPSMLHFLKQHENYTLFLLGNFENYGTALSEAAYSGNFKLIRSSAKVVGVFCLTKNGTLLIEAAVRDPIFDIVLTSCQEEQIPLNGLLGNWNFCSPFWNYLKNQKMIQKELLASKEILYSVDLATVSYPSEPAVRLLVDSDYNQWKPLRLDYIEEKCLPMVLNDDQLSGEFLDMAKKKISWGYFLEDKLVSIANLNAKALDLGQVGGVYTAPGFRQKGYSKSVMKQLLADAKKLHGIRKLMIFTGEENFSAQKLYKSFGALHVGYFALFFSASF